MIRRLIQQNSSIIHLNFTRSIANASNLAINYSANKQNEDLSDEVTSFSGVFNKKSRSKIQSNLSLRTTFKQFLYCSDKEVDKIMSKNKKLMEAKPSQISDMIQFLLEMDISIKSIVDNPWLLSMNQGKCSKSCILFTIIMMIILSRIPSQKDCEIKTLKTEEN